MYDQTLTLLDCLLGGVGSQVELALPAWTRRGTVELVGAVCAVGPAVAAPAEADALAALAAELARGVAGVAGAQFKRNFLA